MTRPAKRGVADGSRARVRRYYERSVAHEAGRLDEEPYRRLERDITLRTLARHVPSGASVLDVGGGPGAYLEPLVRLGYDVQLCDLAVANVRRARRRALSLALDSVTERVRRADATDLRCYRTASVDAALVAGPFYHLLDRSAQEHALAEILRVVRPGGVLLATLLPRLHPLRYLLREASRASWRCLEALDWEALLDDGRYRNPLGDDDEPLFFTDSYLWEVDAFHDFLGDAGCRVVETLSTEGFCAFGDVPLRRWARSEAAYERILDLVERTGRRADSIGAAEHVLVVATTPPA